MTDHRCSLRRDASVSSPRHSFTLVELIVVLTIIFVLTGLVFTAAGFIAKKGARSRAESEMAALAAAVENYKSDNGNYPRDNTGNGNCSNNCNLWPNNNQSATDCLDANGTGLQIGDPTSDCYRNASQYLYGQLSGDYDNSAPTASTNYNAVLDTTNEKANRVYFNFPPSMLSISVITAANSPHAVPGRITGPTAATGAIGPAGAINLMGAAPAGTGASGGTGPTGNNNNTYTVNFIRDPFGYPYGYSTARQAWMQNPQGNSPPGFNPTYDLWSTAASICQNCSGQPTQKCCSVAQSQAGSTWITNW